MRQKLQEINHSEAHKLREVLKENNQFKVKLKALIEENDELRIRIERIDSHQSSLIRGHAKTVTDLTSKMSLLEVNFTGRSIAHHHSAYSLSF
jgi:hypothetical protein